MPQLRKEDWFERYILPGLACEKGRILPINIVGQKAAEVRQTLLARDSRRQIGVLTAVTSVDDCKQWLLPHSSTMVLDPDVAKAIAHSSPLMEAVSLKTAGWLMMPLVIRPEPFLYILREPFSFEEPVADDNAENRWCWTAKADPAVVEIIHCRPEGAYRVSFVLSSQNPGNFKIELNGQGQKFSLKGKELARTCIFKISLGEGANFLRISFDGKPFPVGPGDERKQLYYCLSGLKVEALNNDLENKMDNKETLRDRVIRRAFHRNGFFEITTFAAECRSLQTMAGLRSCFDYQEGFSLRDYRAKTSLFEANTEGRQAEPVMWYRFSKTPAPGSEW